MADQIKVRLDVALSFGTCDLILVLDDLDCHDAVHQKEMFSDAIDSKAANIKRCIGFASPELEVWILADWENTFAKHLDFRKFHRGMQHRLRTEHNFSFDDPECFSEYDPDRDACREKLSESVRLAEKLAPFSKGSHTPELLKKVDSKRISVKCPLFKELHICLKTFCNEVI